MEALCLECHRSKSTLEHAQATGLESRFSRRAVELYVHSPRPPPLVCHLHACREDRECHGLDVVRCRKNALANAAFPLPVFCPLDSVERAEEGRLADLTYVRLRRDGRCGALSRLPYLGPGWYSKPAAAYMLERGIAAWQDFEWSTDATAHVEPRCLAEALRAMEDAWPEEEEHYAKLSVNALIGLWARSRESAFHVRTSNSELDVAGADYRQCFADAKGQLVYDYVYETPVVSNGSYRPAHDFVMAAEHVAVARLLHGLRAVPHRTLKAVKTDCIVFQDLAKKHWPTVQELTQLEHRDGSRVYRCEAVAPLPERPPWRDIGAEGAEEHCLANRSLLLTGMPGVGKTYLAKRIVARLREAGKAVQIISKTHCSVQNLGMGAQTADHSGWCGTGAGGPSTGWSSRRSPSWTAACGPTSPA